MSALSNVLWVGLGGGVGSIGRYALGAWIQGAVPAALAPAGTLAANLIGCFSIGVLGMAVELRDLLSSEARALVFVGLLGGFPTFSTFASETLALGRDGAILRSGLYVFATVVGCLLAAWIGIVVGRLLWGGS